MARRIGGTLDGADGNNQDTVTDNPLKIVNWLVGGSAGYVHYAFAPQHQYDSSSRCISSADTTWAGQRRFHRVLAGANAEYGIPEQTVYNVGQAGEGTALKRLILPVPNWIHVNVAKAQGAVTSLISGASK